MSFMKISLIFWNNLANFVIFVHLFLFWLLSLIFHVSQVLYYLSLDVYSKYKITFSSKLGNLISLQN